MTDNSFIGKILRGRYKILQQIEENEYEDTYQAIDSNLSERSTCLVRRFKPKDFQHPSMLEIAKEKFYKDAEDLSRLGDYNEQIPRVFDYFEENEQFYLVQEFIDGYDLCKEIFVSDYSNEEQKVLQLLIEILEVLAFVHQRVVIHGDIKPQNIIRRKDGKIVLTNFGTIKEVAALEVDHQGKTFSTVRVGTPGYIPSEQRSGGRHFSSDIYAVGIIAFQVLTAFYISPQKLPRDVHTGELSCTLLSGRKNISPAFAQILDKMVRYDYRQRYRNASLVLEELQNLLKTKQRTGVVLPSNSYLNGAFGKSQQNTDFNSGIAIESEPSLLQKVIAFFRDIFVEYEPENFPQPAAEFNPIVNRKNYEQPEGQVSLDSAFYIERPPIENDCYETILQPGALIRIKAPRQMGKTSLLSRTLDYAKQQGTQAAYLNLQSADARFLNNFDSFLQWFCGSIAQELNLPDKLDRYWQGVLGSKNKSTNYFQRYLLSEIKTPLVLGLDEVDQLFQYPEVAGEFFALLRAWHEKSKNEVTWQKLRLAIVHSKEVYIPLNINQSPFNVGLPIDLPEFTQSQIENLVVRHRLNWSQEDVKQLMTMVGGHPYLVRIALHEIARGRITLSQFLQLAPTEQGIFSDHLRRHLYNLQDDKTLVAAMKQTIASNEAVRLDTGLAFKLRSMGLVKFKENDVIPLCNLYRLYFRENLSN
ncbi:hypothetical protein NIES267_15320 [Calothrix parasitica NIES-267]|uniref:non-specific serine/threonine protein kinase n=1 Tax=Calothrix parasitica NIES-267 TaxID=1973488 RepID=A0A1Z4LLJ4_9CYAN|nr:hypothetical protein NIES267_15320 [Calothrix parasitica NIES-267]